MQEAVDRSEQLTRFPSGGQSPDPFQALKADAIAQSLAPRQIQRAGEVRLSFCFEGHGLLFRELDLLRAAWAFVDKVLHR